ncbi:MAG: alanine racemase [Fidelibacterota bacterium]|nr:MAG: alanine racemase [Candidatus Neomarinimicrobiota bacterium]
MAARTSDLGVALRPHIKTHKCIEIARLQIEGGAQGLTVATLDEADVFAPAGFNDITHAFPLDQGKIARALDTAARITLRVVVDSRAVVEALEKAAADRGQKIHVWLKVDCGYHRAGVDPSAGYATELAHRIHVLPHLEFDGLLTHAGHAYKASTTADVLGIARQERDVLVEFARDLERVEVPIRAISVGSTPTVSVVDHLEGVQEVRPGNYVFYDRTQVMLGSCKIDDCAVTVLATVVSMQPNRRQAVMDAGALALSHDPGPVHLDQAPSKGAIVTGTDPSVLHPHLRITSLSQEHGILEGDRPEDLAGLEVGSRVRLLPNHSCLAVALFDEYQLVVGEQVVDQWSIQRSRSYRS